ncbi:hypothetical protein Spa11_10150 [Botrimarina mediterranea]|uniref:Uncharacterized protein n=1 Tax=Botrimarina mediterranea TaxID=2528022 RepID=A0A518K4W2_9BACT|nr:hypothetical protein Spa11_10150 [Botrimarina mediterranea]
MVKMLPKWWQCYKLELTALSCGRRNSLSTKLS